MKKVMLLAVAVALLWGVTADAAKPRVPLGNPPGSGRFDQYHQTWNRTLSPDTVYTLYGIYYVDSLYALTVPAGTVIEGDTVGTLCVKRGAQGYFLGEMCNPVVMTSIKPPTQRARGDWGGLVICGAGLSTRPSSTFIEGGIVKAQFGGNIPDDNSGVYKYLRVEYPGFRFQLNDEINGITMGAVGSGTEFHHVQVSYAFDDQIEFFGGGVNIHHCVALGGTDDEFDTDFGYNGKAQFLFGLRDPFYWDAQGQSRGFESDGDFSGTPQWTHPIYCNVTLVGPRRTDSTLIPPGTTFEWSAVPREGSQLSVFNSILMGYPLGISIRDQGADFACSGDLVWENVSLQAETFDGDATGAGCPEGAGVSHVHDESRWPCPDAICGQGVLDWANSSGIFSSTRMPSSIGLMDMSDLNNPDPRPSPGSEPLTAGVSYTHAQLQDAFFDTSPTYRGAFDPDLPMYAQWTRCWTNFDPQNTDYSDGVTPTAVTDDGGTAPKKDVVLENRPNPFNPTTTIRFSVPASGRVTIQVFSVRGELVATVLDRDMSAGVFEEVFNAAGLSTGTYFYRITGNGFTKTSKMVLLK
ncbi:MAG: T9SS type A sorting domain-containing protein [Candidatus Latescibacterota bacterium]|jgi:hypothetical protein